MDFSQIVEVFKSKQKYILSINKETLKVFEFKEDSTTSYKINCG